MFLSFAREQELNTALNKEDNARFRQIETTERLTKSIDYESEFESSIRKALELLDAAEEDGG